MKLFDEKGKLFGKINIIDLLVIVVILAAIVVVGVKFLGNDASPAPSESMAGKTMLTYTVRVTAQREEIAEVVRQYVDVTQGKKDQLMHGESLVANAYVVDFWTEPCRYNITVAGDMEMIGAAEADAADLVDFCLVVEAVVENTTTNEVGMLEVRVGKTHVLKTTHMEFGNGVVVDCVWEPMEG